MFKGFSDEDRQVINNLLQMATDHDVMPESAAEVEQITNTDLSLSIAELRDQILT